MQKLVYINPAASHNVFLWWHYFFSRYFDYHTYHHGQPSEYETHHVLQYNHLIRIGKNFVVFYKKSAIDVADGDVLIIGDIFTNLLAYKHYPTKKILYYSEFFLFRKSLWKRLFFYCTVGLLFRKKKFIVPTQLAYDTYKRVSSHTFYMPPLYYGDVHTNTHDPKDVIKLLFVWRVSQAYKNIYFLIEQFLKARKWWANLQLTIVGEMFETDFYDRYQEHLDSGAISYLWQQTQGELHTTYSNHDIFVLPSDSDPIGAVVLEAMAHGLAVLVSDSVGASCYVESWKDGYVFATNNVQDFQDKLHRLLEYSHLVTCKEHASIAVQEKYSAKNQQLTQKIYDNLSAFISS
jgi:glycosyltransferase involved in cell wall biosynthesis